MQPRMAELLFYLGDLEWSQLSGHWLAGGLGHLCWLTQRTGGGVGVHITVINVSRLVGVGVTGLLSGCY